MDDVLAILKHRLEALEERLGAACARSGRPREAVRLVAVTKTVSADVAALLAELGVLDLGESRPQELWHKEERMLQEARWHLIGHLQRNKVERTLMLAHLIHSVDSLRLLEALEAAAVNRPKPASVLLEVNASRESNKHGFPPEEVAAALARLSEFPHVQVRGLMTMAALTGNPEDARPTFAAVRELRDRVQRECDGLCDLGELSMGMTNDFEVAIEEGATLVRIGSALFEGLPMRSPQS